METEDYIRKFQEFKVRPAVYTDVGGSSIPEMGFNAKQANINNKIPNDHAYSLPLFLIAYMLFKIIQGAFSNDNTKLQGEREKRIQEAISPGVLYYVNGRKIDRPVSKYYLQYLGLQNHKLINLEDIRSAALAIFHQYESDDSEFLMSFRIDIKAATLYLTDQWCYAHCKN